MTANEIDAHVGERMRRRRTSLGISQGKLGRHLGLTFSQVQKYEKGANRISAGRLYLLGAFLGVPVQYFFDGLEDAFERRNGSEHGNGKHSDIAVLDDAFLCITDHDTRQSVLALVRSLASMAEPVAAAAPLRESVG